MSYDVTNEGDAMNLATSAHTRTAFDADLQGLVRMAAEMGGLAERQILQSIEALAQKNADLARQVIDDDAALDAFQTKIEKWASRSSLSISRLRVICVRQFPRCTFAAI